MLFRSAFAKADALGLADALSMEAQVQRGLAQGADAREGIAAFLAKRAPRFVDR